MKKSPSNGDLENQATVDSLSDNIAKSEYQIQLVPWVRQENIVVHDSSSEKSISSERITDTTKIKKQLLSFLSGAHESKHPLDDNSKDNTERKNSVKEYLKSHQLNVRESENQNLIIEDLVTLRAPYTSYDCEGTNQIVLDRIRNLINQLDSDQQL